MWVSPSGAFDAFFHPDPLISSHSRFFRRWHAERLERFLEFL
jgi:hypothetical protein